MTADVDTRLRSYHVYCGDLLKGKLFRVNLYETVMFRLFNGADSTVQIMLHWMRNYSVITVN
jgi:hypothetical protein